MAESTLATTYDDLREILARDRGWDLQKLYAQDSIDMAACIKQGLQRAYAAKDGYRWTFLDNAHGTITTVEPYSTGTIAVAAGVVTLSGGTWPTWAADGDLVYGGVTYTVASRDSNSQITLDDTSLAVSSGADYQLVQQIYDLPADFCGVQGNLAFRPGNSHFTDEIQMRADVQLRLANSRTVAPTPNFPRYYALLPKAFDARVGERYQMMFDVPTDAVYVIHYRYRVNPNTIDPTNKYPHGGQLLARVLREAVLAEMEMRLGVGQIGGHDALFQEALAIAMDLDRAVMVPDQLGSAVRQSEVGQCDDLYAGRRRTDDLITLNI
jgi:hypothetical protein